MNAPLLVASVDDVVGELVLQVWPHLARGGALPEARGRAERAVERLLGRGLPSARGANGATFLDPYATCNALKSRRGEFSDEAWEDWVETARANAVSLPTAPHRYRLKMRREWRLPPSSAGRPVVLRLPLPLRDSLVGLPDVQLIEPGANALIARRDEPGRVELRLDPAAVRGRVEVEMTIEFVSGEVSEVRGASPSDSVAFAAEEIWLRPKEGLITPSVPLEAFARGLPGESQGAGPARELTDAAFDRLLSTLRLGDLHGDHLAADDPLGGLLTTSWVDCRLAANLFVAVCRTRGIPARMISGYLLHRAFPAPHFWAEARVEPGQWVPFDFGGWDYCRGDPSDPTWGGFFRGRIDARFITEVAPRDFTGWGSARPPDRWFRKFALRGSGVAHTLHALPSGDLFQGDHLDLEVLEAVGALPG